MSLATYKKLLVSAVLLLGTVVSLLISPSSTKALSGSDWQAGNIITDGVFFDYTALNAGDIQNFLNSKVPVCDTNGTQPHGGGTRAQYGTSQGYPPPYTCLKDYTQSVPSKGPDSFCDSGINGATKTAAQIIFDVSQACKVNPKVLIVLLQKEQSLVTDDWPWSVQYRSATGFGCPDGAPCDAEYYGFFNQVYNAARQFQRYARQPQNYNFRGGVTSNVQYHPNAGCGSSPVSMQNQATAGLYNYTPYQPNAAALANLYGTGDGCSAYGNRNFWRTFIDWFGSTQISAPYAWGINSFQIYSNSARTQTFSSDTTVAPEGKVYIRVRATNIGNQTWTQSSIRIGTSHPLDRSSQFYDSSWFNTIRPAQLLESSVAPGSTGTFEFTLKAPITTGQYQEYFNLVAENITWFNDLNASIIINVVSPVAASNTYNTSLQSGQSLYPQDYLLSPDGQSVLALQNDGNLVLYGNFRPLWNSVTFGKALGRAVMQEDGNFVIYFQDGSNWSTGTFGYPNSTLELQSDGNLVVYDQNRVARWNSVTFHNPNHLSYVNTTLFSGVANGGTLFQRQQLETADRRYRLVFQADGNLVLYSTNRALWSANTHGRGGKYVSLQMDGNLVMYNDRGQALWNTVTHGNGPSRLVVQQDGNLVLYNSASQATWNTVTFGQF